MPLSVSVSSSLRPLAQALGFSLAPQSSGSIPPSPASVKKAWASGQVPVVCTVTRADELWELRPLALFAEAFGEPLRSGSFQSPVRAYGGLIASRWHTPQQGSLLFAHNPLERPCTGSVFPAFEERLLDSGETLIWPHDFPLGRSENYLAAYAGLVKSDAPLLTAHIRPDPYPGARLFVLGKPGEEREVTVFNAGPGESVEVVFEERRPRLYSVGVSQVVALPEVLAPYLWLLEERTLFGTEWALSHDGQLESLSGGWQETTLQGDDEPRSAQLFFEGQAPELVFVNQIPVLGSEVVLLPGENTIQVRGAFGPAYVIPDGACFQVELTEWVSLPSR